MKIFSKNIISIYGSAGDAWLFALPHFLKEIEKARNIKIEKPFQNLTYHYAAIAIQSDGSECVFKCGVPNEALVNEIHALQYFDRNGAVKLLDSDENKGWLLLEKCSPGVSLSKLKEDQATLIAIQTMQSLWRPIDDNHLKFRHIKDWFQGLQRAKQSNSIVPKKLIHDAILMSEELLSSLGEVVLLHADLHHDNILSASRQPFLAIDPNGIFGEREYEIGAFMRNPYSITETDTNLKKCFDRRLSIITELTGFDRERLLMWTFVQAVLAAWWHVEDHTNGIENMQCVATVSYEMIIKK